MTWFPYLLVAAVAWGALAFGAVYPWAYRPLALLCAGLGVWALVRFPMGDDRRVKQLAIALGAAGLAIGLQIVALPYAVLLRLSPGVDAFLRERTLVYHPASTHPLSIAPDRTLESLALFVAFALLFLGLTLALRHLRLDWLMNQLLGIGLVLTVIGVVQKAAYDPRDPMLYGFWAVPNIMSTPFGPFINRNHFAGWMVMALPLVVGYSFAVLGQSRRPADGGWRASLRWLTTVDASRFVVVAFTTLAMGMAVVLSGSRSGVAALAGAMVAFGWLALGSPHGRPLRAVVRTYGIVLLLGAVTWAGTEGTISRFAQAREHASGRLNPWSDAMRMIADFPVFGIGVGAYRPAVSVYQVVDRHRLSVQAHNEYLQLMAEGGLLVGIPAVAVLVLVVAGIRRRFTSGADDPETFWIRTGAVAGLVGIAAQSLVDFTLQIIGTRALFVLLVAIALHRPSRTRTRPR